jgi:hypothetical protein
VDADVIVWINADIILPRHFTQLVTQIARAFPEYLLIGQRYSLDVGDQLIDFSNRTEAAALFRSEAGQWDGHQAIDYFVFNRGVWAHTIPPDLSLAWAWDQFLVSHASRLGLRTVDATPAIRAIHQSHSRIRDKDADSAERQRNLAVVMANGGWIENGFVHCALYEVQPCRRLEQGAGAESGCAEFPLRRRPFPAWSERSPTPHGASAASVTGHRDSNGNQPQHVEA